MSRNAPAARYEVYLCDEDADHVHLLAFDASDRPLCNMSLTPEQITALHKEFGLGSQFDEGEDRDADDTTGRVAGRVFDAVLECAGFLDAAVVLDLALSDVLGTVEDPATRQAIADGFANRMPKILPRGTQRAERRLLAERDEAGGARH
ncbi:MAG: hypothetical protein FWD12_10160 [Alphaproteobacteria bacterium]|nr:hypothetical protein [Alphaproteobacteria bacterium]